MVRDTTRRVAVREITLVGSKDHAVEEQGVSTGSPPNALSGKIDRLSMFVISCALLSPWGILLADPALALGYVTDWSRYSDAVTMVAIGCVAIVAFDFSEWWIDAAMGLWLMISPWVMGYLDVRSLTWCAATVGASMVLLAARVLATRGLADRS